MFKTYSKLEHYTVSAKISAFAAMISVSVGIHNRCHYLSLRDLTFDRGGPGRDNLENWRPLIVHVGE
jgi:hypothetical protein